MIRVAMTTVNPRRPVRPDRRSKPSPDDTRSAIVAAARALFGAHGPHGVSMEQIQERARVSRGGLYHHFRSKIDALYAVCDAIESEIMARVVACAGNVADPIERLVIGGHAYLDEWVDAPEVVRICLLGSRHALSWDQWHEIATRNGLGITRAVIEEAAGAGLLVPDVDVDALTSVLVGAYIEGGTTIALSEDQRATRAVVGAALEALVRGLARPAVAPKGQKSKR